MPAFSHCLLYSDAARGELHSRLEQLKSRHAALAKRKQVGYAEQFELVRVRAAMRITLQRKKSLAHEFVERRAAAEAAEADALASRLQALGAAALHHSQSQAFGTALSQGSAAAGTASGTPPAALWPMQSLTALRQLKELRPQLVLLATQLTSILRVAPTLQAVQTFCRPRVQAATAGEGGGAWGGRGGSVAAAPRGNDDSRSVLSAPALLDSAVSQAPFGDFELDLLGEGRLQRLLGGVHPPTQASEALEDATSSLNELRDIISRDVEPRLSAAWGMLRAVRTATTCLHGRPALPDELVAEAAPGCTADHVWLEPVDESAEDAHALRLFCGAVGVQLQLLTALYTKACRMLQLQTQQPNGASAAHASNGFPHEQGLHCGGSVLSGVSTAESSDTA